MRRSTIQAGLWPAVLGLLVACGSPAQTPTPDPQASPASTPDTQEPTTPEPVTGSFGISYPFGIGFTDIAVIITADRLNAQGWNIEHIPFTASEAAVEAVARNEAQLGVSATSAYLSAIQAGARIRIIGERSPNEWVLVSSAEIESCEDLHGRSLGIHSPGSDSTAMTNAWIDANCAGTEPSILAIPGSENRVVALLAGEIDATPLETDDWVQLNAEGDGAFSLLVNFSEDLADLYGSAISANEDFIRDDREVLVTFLTELLRTHREIVEDPALLEAATREHFPEIDAELVPDVVAAYLAIGTFQRDDVHTEQRIEYTLGFFTDSGRLEPGLAVEDVADFALVDEALARLNTP